jgi:hypothetical membrane protein
VHRSVHYGALGLVLAAAVFIVVNLVVPFGYSGFSVTANSIGDLGNAARSSWAWVFDAGAIAFGVIGLAGGFLVWTAFPIKTSRTVGLLLLELAFIGAIGLGAFPQGSPWTIAGLPSVSIDLFLIASALGLLLLSFAMLRDTRWSGYRLYTLLSAVVSLVALALLWAAVWGPLGPGGLERLAVAPFLLWLLVAGTHLARIPTYTPPGLSVSA